MIKNKDEENIIKNISKNILFIKEEYQQLDCFLSLIRKSNLKLYEIFSMLNNNKEYNNTHIDLLVNILFEKFEDEIFFYIPELISLMQDITYQKTSLLNFILEQCKNNIKYSLIVNWFFASYKNNKITDLIEETFINGNLNLKNHSNEKKILEYIIFKKLKTDYFYSNNYFYQELINLCEELKNIPKENNERNKYLHNKIDELNL